MRSYFAAISTEYWHQDAMTKDCMACPAYEDPIPVNIMFVEVLYNRTLKQLQQNFHKTIEIHRDRAIKGSIKCLREYNAANIQTRAFAYPYVKVLKEDLQTIREGLDKVAEHNRDEIIQVIADIQQSTTTIKFILNHGQTAVEKIEHFNDFPS